MAAMRSTPGKLGNEPTDATIGPELRIAGGILREG
jgi:hypothetical protein